MTEDEIKAELRLYAIEVFVSNLFAVECLKEPSPLELAERIRGQMLDGARKKSFPEVDPAMSDLLSAELESAVARLTGMANEQIRLALQRRAAREP